MEMSASRVRWVRCGLLAVLFVTVWAPTSFAQDSRIEFYERERTESLADLKTFFEKRTAAINAAEKYEIDGITDRWPGLVPGSAGYEEAVLRIRERFERYRNASRLRYNDYRNAINAYYDEIISEIRRESPKAGVSGVWSTSFGEMRLWIERDGSVSGSYTSNRVDDVGNISDGKLSGHTLTGFWDEAHAARSCDTARNGRPCWGRFEFVFNDTFTAFTGTWGYCGDALTGDWTGTKN